MLHNYLKNWFITILKKKPVGNPVNISSGAGYSDKTFCSFIITFEIEGEAGYIAVHPQMVPARNGLKLKGDFFLYCVFPRRGSCYFVIRQDQDDNWIADDLPEFVGLVFLKTIGERIVDDFIAQTGKKNFNDYS